MKTFAWIALPLLAVTALQDPAKKEAPAPAPTDQPAAESPRAADEKAIHDLLGAFTAAFNSGNSKALAALFTAQARMAADDEEPIVGRDAIEKRFSEGFTNFPGMTIEIASEDIVFLDDDTALEEGTAVISRGEEHVPEVSRYSVVYIKENGKWLQASITEHTEPSPPTPADHLDQLAWMIGEWVDESDEAHVTTTCAWDENHAFLVRNFEVNISGRPALSGTQRIGWDPVRKAFRSWVFDSHGGFAEGTWTQIAENSWTIRNEGVTADGEPASSTSTVTYVNDHTIHWTTADRRVGDESFPEPVEIVMVHKPPAPAGRDTAVAPDAPAKPQN
jgi:uncharacterized protein (TIGR02246 family)